MRNLLLGAALIGAVLPAAIAAAEPSRGQRKKALEHIRAGEKALLERQLDKAEREFGAAIERDPLQLHAHYGLGRTYLAMKRYEDAVSALTRCRTAVAEMEALRLRNEAEAHERREDEIESLHTLRGQLLQARNPPPNLQAQVVQIESRIRDLERKRDRASEGLEVPAAVSLSLGAAHFRLERMAEAEAEYRAAIAADPSLGEAHNNLAVLLMLTGRLEEAGEEILLAEKSGFAVNPQFKQDLGKARVKKDAERDAAATGD